MEDIEELANISWMQEHQGEIKYLINQAIELCDRMNLGKRDEETFKRLTEMQGEYIKKEI